MTGNHLSLTLMTANTIGQIRKTRKTIGQITMTMNSPGQITIIESTTEKISESTVEKISEGTIEKITRNIINKLILTHILILIKRIMEEVCRYIKGLSISTLAKLLRNRFIIGSIYCILFYLGFDQPLFNQILIGI